MCCLNRQTCFYHPEVNKNAVICILEVMEQNPSSKTALMLAVTLLITNDLEEHLCKKLLPSEFW